MSRVSSCGQRAARQPRTSASSSAPSPNACSFGSGAFFERAHAVRRDAGTHHDVAQAHALVEQPKYVRRFVPFGPTWAGGFRPAAPARAREPGRGSPPGARERLDLGEREVPDPISQDPPGPVETF
jgi:hypothetical protein